MSPADAATGGQPTGPRRSRSGRGRASGAVAPTTDLRSESMDPHAAYSEADPIVAYRVADLLDRMGTRLDEGIATLLAKLDDKAGKADLAAITARLEEHGKKILAIEERLRVDEASAKAVQAQRDAWRDWRRWAIGLFACVAASAGAWVPLIK